MMENRSFDHMLGSLRAQDARIDGLSGTETNPDMTGTRVPVAPPSLSRWVNLEGSRARGLESSVRLRIVWMRVRAQYILLHTRVTATASPASATAASDRKCRGGRGTLLPSILRLRFDADSSTSIPHLSVG